NSLVWLGSLSRCLRAFNSLTVFSDSSASPGVEAARFATLPGRLHTSDSSPTAGPPIRRMLPWSTCGHTQGLVRIAPAKQYRLQLHVTTNVETERCGRPSAPELAAQVARPHSLQ